MLGSRKPKKMDKIYFLNMEVDYNNMLEVIKKLILSILVLNIGAKQ